MTLVREFDLFLTAGHSVPLVINVNQYDQGEQWIFTLYNSDGTQYTPSSGSIVGVKSDGFIIANAGTVDESGKVVITETEQMTAAAGKAVFELQLDSNTHGTANFIVLVETDPSDGGEVSGSDISLLRQALDGGLSQSAIDALLACFANVAWVNDDGQTYYDALEDALNAVRVITLNTNTLSFSTIGSTQQLTATTVPEGGTVTWESSNTSVATVSSSGLVTTTGYGTATITASSGDVSATCSVSVVQATLVSISAVYTQSGTVYDTDSLDSLKADLVVTATYDNQTTETVPSADYTLSGTLTAGTSTITVAYGGKTTTFTVTVTSYEKYSYSLTNDDLIKFVGSVGWTAENGLTLNNGTSSQNGRRAFVLDYGVQQLQVTTNNTTFTDSGYYPIPVPHDATSVSVAITPSSQYFGISGYTLSEGFYTRVLDDGWKQGSRTVTFMAGAYDYITIGSKYNSTGSSYPTEPSELTITFE